MRKMFKRSPRFTEEQHERIDRIEDVATIIRGVEKDREEDEVQPVYGLGVQKKPISKGGNIIIVEEEEDEEIIALPFQHQEFTKGPRSISP